MIIKKKNLKSFRNIVESDSKVELEELVDADGSPIEGDRTVTNDSEIETSPQQTTDDFAKSAIQPNRRTSMYGGIGAYSVNARIESDEKEGDIVENINSDLDGNTVPDINDLSTKYQKPIVVGKCNDFIKTISKNGLNGEETGIALYYILSNLDVKQLPDIYKNNIKNLFN